MDGSEPIIYEGSASFQERSNRVASWYSHTATRYPQEMFFLNLGYGEAGEETEASRTDNPVHYGMQLYRHVAGAVPLGGKDVLEVGCGRGGGAFFSMKKFQPRSLCAIDLCAEAIVLCQRTYNLAGLSFEVGDALDLPADDAVFDAVINVESSHSYASFATFLGEVRRVLRPGGHFLFADIRLAAEIPQYERDLARGGMSEVFSEDITRNVFEALRLTSRFKEEYIASRITPAERKRFGEFAGIAGSRYYEGLRDGRYVYKFHVLQR